MKKIIKTTLVLLITITTISCGNKSEKKEADSKKIEQTEEQQHSSSENSIQLNNGNPWMANIETTQGIANMKKLMDNFSKKENSEAYTQLKSSLEKEFGTIITACTMEGESHNQLHNYLVPMKDYFEGLASKDILKCKKTYNELNKHLAEYSTYFK
ncbi:hypothetical protein Lupro_09340 [Lutibacter profundi]|uniref:Lipoprotein n=1 Tax=Lutibacter profundi TaxID=1622118 RepID=A0A120IEE7_9FLAO|nr:hypothetical protein [Lutibacter profundi]AMC11455.1 hypothetical protein Lupro_09340 [Lutibacter profundi]